MNKTKQLFAGLSLMALSLGTALAGECAHYEGDVCLPKGFPVEGTPSNYALNLMQGVTDISKEIYDLHQLILGVCVIIGIVVFGAMFYSIYHHRKSKGHVAKQFHESTKVEIIWTVIPFLILVGMAVAATDVLIDLHRMPKKLAEKSANGDNFDVTVKVTGHQWYWEYEVLGTDKKFDSYMERQADIAKGTGINPQSIQHYLLHVDRPLVIPVKKKIRFVFTSADVIHSWWVPDLGWKKDANPGFINEAWTYVEKPGVYRGQCTELCGRLHGFMPVVVVAMEQADYEKWLNGDDKVIVDIKKDEQPHDMLVQEGAKIYEKKCASCHQADGKGTASIPALTDSKVVNGDMAALVQFVSKGKGMMPAFGKQFKPIELAQVITFIRNGLGNKKGDDIQAKAIEALLAGGKEATVGKETTAGKETAPAAAKDTKDTKPASDAAAKKDDVKKDDVKKDDAKKPVAAKTEAAKLSKEDLMSKGKEVYSEMGCASCHGEEGQGGMGPALKGSPVVKGDINAQAKLILNGKGGMPAFGDSLEAADTAAIVTYTRNSLGNSVGDLIQPSAIQSLQSGK